VPVKRKWAYVPLTCWVRARARQDRADSGTDQQRCESPWRLFGVRRRRRADREGNDLYHEFIESGVNKKGGGEGSNARWSTAR